MGFCSISAGKESACNEGDLGSIPGGEWNNYPLQHSGRENPMDYTDHKESDTIEWLSLSLCDLIQIKC